MRFKVQFILSGKIHETIVSGLDSKEDVIDMLKIQVPSAKVMKVEEVQ